jgi:hypothetical protein
MIDMWSNFLISFSYVLGGAFAIFILLVALMIINGITAARAANKLSTNMHRGMGDLLKEFDEEDKKK